MKTETKSWAKMNVDKLSNYGKIKKDSNFQNDIVSSFFGAVL